MKQVDPSLQVFSGVVRECVVIPRTNSAGNKVNMILIKIASGGKYITMQSNPGYLANKLEPYGVELPQTAVDKPTIVGKMTGLTIECQCEVAKKDVTTYLDESGKVHLHKRDGNTVREMFVIDSSSLDGRSIAINHLEKSGATKFAITTAANSISATAKAMIANYVDDDTDDVPEGVTLGAAVEQ